MEVRSCFPEIRERHFLKLFIWPDCEPYGNDQYNRTEYNQHSSLFKEFKNNDH